MAAGCQHGGTTIAGDNGVKQLLMNPCGTPDAAGGDAIGCTA